MPDSRLGQVSCQAQTPLEKCLGLNTQPISDLIQSSASTEVVASRGIRVDLKPFASVRQGVYTEVVCGVGFEPTNPCLSTLESKMGSVEAQP